MSKSLPSKGKLLALDLGKRRTGVAVTDLKQSVVFPRDPLDHGNEAELFEQIQAFVEKEGVQGIVIGMPELFQGQNGEQKKWTEKMLEQIQKKLNLPIASVDERFTSQMAKRDLKRDKDLDSTAAMFCLQSYLGL